MNYYGVRYSKNCHPNDLFVTYFTSSKHVSKYILEHGAPDIVEIRQTFSGEDRVALAQSWEYRVLSRLNASNRTDYLNKTNNKSINLSDPEVELLRKTNLSLALKSEVTRNRLRQSAKKQWSDPEKRKFILERQRQEDFCENRTKARALQVGTNASHVDNTQYTFVHDNGTIENCTRLTLKKKYNLHDGNLCLVIQGKRKKHKGWSVN
jgi:hypothetical protein